MGTNSAHLRVEYKLLLYGLISEVIDHSSEVGTPHHNIIWFFVFLYECFNEILIKYC